MKFYHAYADESCFNTGRFRAISLISCTEESGITLREKFNYALEESDVNEFKWTKLRNSKYRFAAIKMLEIVFEGLSTYEFRLDTLSWDTYDRRHSIKNRDDNENLQRMYYHLFKNVILKRWSSGKDWILYPDEQSFIRWNAIEKRLKNRKVRIIVDNTLDDNVFGIDFEHELRIKNILPTNSKLESLIQVVDLFAGLSVFSREKHSLYRLWKKINNPQKELFTTYSEPKQNISNSDRERFKVLDYLSDLCKRKKVGVSLKTSEGLRTYNPSNRINFWWYEPQHEMDLAPVKKIT